MGGVIRPSWAAKQRRINGQMNKEWRESRRGREKKGGQVIGERYAGEGFCKGTRAHTKKRFVRLIAL